MCLLRGREGGWFCYLLLGSSISVQALAAEVTSAFSRHLSPLNMTVRELTGDMQLSNSELEETQVAFVFNCCAFMQ